MNEQQEFLKRLVGLLEEAGIPYMVAGSAGQQPSWSSEGNQ